MPNNNVRIELDKWFQEANTVERKKVLLKLLLEDKTRLVEQVGENGEEIHQEKFDSYAQKIIDKLAL